VIALNEVDATVDLAAFARLASEAGYPFTALPTSNPFGPDRNAFLSRLPILRQEIHTSASLSGQAAANDLTRLIVEITVDVPGAAQDLTLISEHWKSGFENTDELRRAVESFRIAQALAGKNPAADAFVVMGDMNAQQGEAASPVRFTAVPAGLPVSFSFGADIVAQLSQGLPNDPFSFLTRQDGLKMGVLSARQKDGSLATRHVSGRRIDYILASQSLLGAPAEIYDSRDEGLPGGLPKLGAPLPPTASIDAADHLPVFADLVLPAAEVELLLSFKDPVTAPGVGAVQANDVVAFHPTSGAFELLFDGASFGLSGMAIDGLAALPSGELLLSFNVAGTISGSRAGPRGGSSMTLISCSSPPTPGPSPSSSTAAISG
jgi:endonuclease/exonuclease/phosphatase family metal-dependent hydrolase